MNKSLLYLLRKHSAFDYETRNKWLIGSLVYCGCFVKHYSGDCYVIARSYEDYLDHERER